MLDSLPTRELGEIAVLRSEKHSGPKSDASRYVGLEHIVAGTGRLCGVASGSVPVSTNCVFHEGDILFGKLRPNLRKCVRASFDGYCSTDILVLEPTHDVDAGFAARVFQQEGVFDRAERTAIGTRMPRTAWRDLKTHRIFIPGDRAEQRRIAEVLDTLDETIGQTEALIGKLKRIRAGLLHDLLTRGVDESGELRDPERLGGKWKDSEIGFVPASWEVTGLKDRAHPSRPHIKTGPFGSSLKGEHWVPEGVPVITIGALGEGELIESELLHVTSGKAASLRECAVREGDLVFSRVADVGRSVVIEASSDGWIMSSNLMRISLDPRKVIPDYAYFALVFDERTRTQVRRYVNSGGRDVANTPILERLQFAWPPFDEQQRIVATANALETKLSVELEQARKLALQKLGLMHDLLTGKVRVPSREAAP